jgi:hypothetical protein
MRILQALSIFVTKITGEPHGEVLGMMTPCSNNHYNYFFTSYDSNMHYLYSAMIGKDELTRTIYYALLPSWVAYLLAPIILICMLVKSLAKDVITSIDLV